MNRLRIRWGYDLSAYLADIVPDYDTRVFAHWLSRRELNLDWSHRVFVVMRNALRASRRKQLAITSKQKGSA